MNDELKSYILESKSLLIQNKFDKCDFVLSKALKSHPYNPELLYIRAFINRKKARFEDSLIDLESAYKHLNSEKPLGGITNPLKGSNPNIKKIIPIEKEKGPYLYDNNQDLELEIRSQIGLTYNEMGMLLYEKSRYNEALPIFSEALKFREQDFGILLNRGDCSVKLQCFTESLSDFFSALEKSGKKMPEITIRIAHIYCLLGTKNFNKGDYKKSLEFFDNMIKFRADFGEYYVRRGKCFYELKDLKRAYDDFQRALELEKGNEEAKKCLGLIKKPAGMHMKHMIVLGE